MPPEEIILTYKTRLVAFIDVMGFRELLQGNIDILQSYYSHAYEFLEGKSSIYKLTAPEDDFKRLFVSDSIILAVTLSENSHKNLEVAARFFSAIALLQYILAVKAKIWTRGAVSVGDLFIEQERNLLVGQAFVQAYELEQLADYPRVIIDPKTLKFFNMSQSDFIRKIDEFTFSGKLIGAGSITRWGMSPFTNNAIQIDWFRQIYDRTEDIEEFFNDLRQRQFSNQKIFEKSNKLIDYLVESFCRFNSKEKEAMKQPMILERAKKVLLLLQTFSSELSGFKFN
jgi:hypothetical protein